MSMSVSASSNALSYLQQLLQSGVSGAGASSTDPLLTIDQTTDPGASNQSGSPSSPVWSGVSPSFEPGTLAALISLQGQSASGVVGQSPSDLFSQIDTDGDGQISKSEFEQALGSVGVDTQSADALFGRLDANDDGEVTPGEIGRAHGHHHHHMGGSGSAQGSSGSQDPLSSLLSGTDITGATTQTATNSDGSTTTTVTYADGTSVSTTSPAASQNSDTSSGGSNGSNGATTAASGAGNLIEELIRLQSQLVSQAAATLSTIA